MSEQFEPRGNGYSGTPPSGWSVRQMKEACTKVTDGTHDTPQTLDAGVPFITAIHVKNGKIDFFNCSYLSAEDHAEVFKRCNPERGDLAVVNIGAGVAECGAVEVDFEFSMKNVALLKPRTDILDHRFLLQSHLHRKDRIAHAIKSGGAQPFMSLSEIRKLPIAIPPLSEQKRIAEILSTWDRAIEATEKLIANSEAQKKALMQQLLTGKKRLPGFSGAWEHHAFGRFAHTVRNKVDPRSLRDDVPGIELEHIEAESGRLLGTCQANAQVSLKTPFTRKNVLYGKLRPYLRKFFKPDFDGVCSTEIWALAAKPDLCTPEFLHLLVQSPTFAGAVDVSSGSKMPRADWGIVAVTIFAIPSVKEQTAIAGILRDADRAIEVHESQLTALRQEKSALMQQLLTGKRRVKIKGEVNAV